MPREQVRPRREFRVPQLRLPRGPRVPIESLAVECGLRFVNGKVWT